MTVRTKQGKYDVLLGPDDPIAKSLCFHREFEQDLISASLTCLRETGLIPEKGKGTLLDVGGNCGVTSIGMLFTGEVQNAITIEPEPRNLELLRHNVAQNELAERIIVLPFAASDHEGVLEFELSPDNSGDHRIRTGGNGSGAEDLCNESSREVIQVKADKVDNLLKQIPRDLHKSITLLWVDVQGHEGYVFGGARGLLSRGIPVVSEISPYLIRRAGMTEDAFIRIVSGLWSSYWVMRRGRFIRYPIAMFDTLFDELGYNPDDYDNVIFTK